MAKLAPFELHGYTLDRATAVILLECWLFSKRPDYSGGILVSHLDGLILRRLVNTLPIKEFLKHWTPLPTTERNRWQAVKLLIDSGLLRKMASYDSRDTAQKTPIYYGVKLTPVGEGLAADLKSLLPERMHFATFRQLIDLANRHRNARNDKTKRATILARIDHLKTQQTNAVKAA